MDMAYPPEADVFRAKVRAFLADNLPEGFAGLGTLEGDDVTNFVTNWRKTLFENGYLALNWPKEYGGGGLTALESVVVAEEFTRAGVPSGAARRYCGGHGMG